MRDGASVLLDPEPLHGPKRQAERPFLIARHARMRAGESASLVKLPGVKKDVARLGTGFEKRVAMLDLRQCVHTPEQRAASFVGKRGKGEIDELSVYIVGRNGRADPVQEGTAHTAALH